MLPLDSLRDLVMDEESQNHDCYLTSEMIQSPLTLSSILLTYHELHLIFWLGDIFKEPYPFHGFQC